MSLYDKEIRKIDRALKELGRSKTPRILTVNEITRLLEIEKVSPRLFWEEAMGGDFGPLPEDDVMRVIEEVQSQD